MRGIVRWDGDGCSKRKCGWGTQRIQRIQKIQRRGLWRTIWKKKKKSKRIPYLLPFGPEGLRASNG